jgi:hypothetical protein
MGFRIIQHKNPIKDQRPEPSKTHNLQERRKRERASPSLGKPTIISLLLKS